MPRTDIESRIAEYRARWEAAPRSRAFIPLADQLRQAGRVEEALAVLEAGLACHPRAIGALVTLARTLAGAGRPAPAAEVATRILEHDPDNLVALEILGEEERRRGDLVAAIGHFERLVQLEPTERHWAGALASLREQKSAVAAAAGGDGEAGFATVTLVDLYLAQGYRQKAVAMLRRLTEQRPGDAALLERLAELEEDGAAASPDRVTVDREPVPPASAAAGPRPAGSDRREQSREQFAMWIERLRADRGVTP